MINKIKSKIASKKLKEIHFSRNVSFKSFEEIKSIGIIYIYSNSNQEELRLARLFIEDMKKQGKTVDSLSLYLEKNIPENISNKQKENIICLSDKSKLGIPSSEIIDNFTNKELDLLIIASLDNIDFLSLLALKSKAKLKVGAEHLSFSDVFDLQIILKDENNLRYLLEQIEFYLKKIKTT